jgi:hypothetical protein
LNNLAFVTKITEKHKFTSPSAIQVKNQRRTISTEEKLDAISQIEKKVDELMTCHNVKFAHISISAIREHADRITESAKSGTKGFV